MNINEISFNSGVRNRNTGIAAQNVEIGRPRVMLLVPKGERLSPSDYATPGGLKAFLKGKAIQDNRAGRYFAIGPVEDYEDANVDPATETIGTFTRTINDGAIGWTIIIPHGGKSHHTSLRGFNNMEASHDLFIVDENNILWGTMGRDVTTNKERVTAFGLGSLEVLPYVIPNTSRGGATRITLRLANSSEFQDTPAFLELGFNFGQEVKGLVDVHLSDVTPSGATAGVYTIAAMAGSQNLAAVYPAILNTAGRWSATRRDTGVSVAIASISAIPAVGFQMTLTVTGIPTGTPIDIRQLSPSDWITAGAGGPGSTVAGFETDTVTVLAP